MVFNYNLQLIKEKTYNSRNYEWLRRTRRQLLKWFTANIIQNAVLPGCRLCCRCCISVFHTRDICVCECVWCWNIVVKVDSIWKEPGVKTEKPLQGHNITGTDQHQLNISQSWFCWCLFTFLKKEKKHLAGNLL